ncbi:MAG TPA: YcxB family protein, partial [Clostridia bacterium]
MNEIVNIGEMEEGVQMQELKIYVKNELEDYKDFIYANSRRMTPGNGITIILSGIIILCFMPSLYSVSIYLSLITLVFYMIMLLPAMDLAALLRYRRIRVNYEKSPLFKEPTCYEFCNEHIVISSRNSNAKVKWDDLFRIVELKPCFMIYTSSNKYLILPKRFLKSQEQLELLRSLFVDKINAKKLKIKSYPLKEITPYTDELFDTQEVMENIEEIDVSGDKSLVEMGFFLEKGDVLSMNFRVLYKTPSVLIFTFIGLSITAFYFVSLRTEDPPVQRLILGLVFTFIFPILIFINVNRTFGKGSTSKNIIKYRFYDGYYIVESGTSTAKVKWCNLNK